MAGKVATRSSCPDDAALERARHASLEDGPLAPRVGEVLHSCEDEFRIVAVRHVVPEKGVPSGDNLAISAFADHRLRRAVQILPL